MFTTKLSNKEIKELEKKFGKHNFCYQCGNPDVKPVEDQHLWKGFCYCPKCGSSDLDEG
jgi:ribosomal protein L37AE/L43A